MLRPFLMTFATGMIGVIVVSSALADTPNMGINLNQNSVSRTAGLWIDVSNLFSNWRTDPFNSSTALTSAQLDTNGFPTVTTATAFSDVLGYATGNYTVQFEGSGTLSLSSQLTGGSSRVNASLSGNGGLTTQSVNIKSASGTGNALLLTINNTNLADPIRNIQIIAPNYTVAQAQSQVFTDDTIRRLKPFSTIRFMDSLQTNTSSIKNFSDHPSVDYWQQTDTTKGFSFDHILTLGKVTKNNIWINVPDQATSQYMTDLAAKIAGAGLDPSQKVYVEYSNELWYYGTDANKRNWDAAKTNPLYTGYDSAKAGQRATDKLKSIHDAFAAYPTLNGKVQFVLGLNPNPGANGSINYDVNYPFNTGSPVGSPIAGAKGALNYYSDLSYVDAVTMPAYIAASVTDATTVDDIFTQLNASLDAGGKLRLQIIGMKALADAYNKPLWVYEGGVDLKWASGNAAQKAIVVAANNDTRMAQIYAKLATVWQQEVGGQNPFLQYSFIDQWASTGTWGLLQSATDSGSVKFDAVMNQLLSKGDTNLDGQVTYDDYLILKLHWNEAGTFWEQGNFNGDGITNLADLQLMYPNLTGLTDAQRQSILDFAPNAAPEPGSAMLLLIAGYGLMRRPTRLH